MSAARRERQRNIEEKINKLSITMMNRIPVTGMLKTFIRDLLKDMKDEATDCMAEKDYQSAGAMLTDAINLKGYLIYNGYSCSSTLDKNLHLLRSECAWKMGHPEASLEDIKEAQRVDPTCERAKVQELQVKYQIALGLCAYQEQPRPLIQVEAAIADCSDEVIRNPQIQNIIKAINQFLRPFSHLDSVRHKPRVRSTSQSSAPSATQNGDASGKVAMEWLPDHVKAATRESQKSKPTPKKKKKTREIVGEFPSERESSEETASVAESDVSSISPRDETKQANAKPAAAPRSYGLDDFGPVEMPKNTSAKINGAIPKLKNTTPAAATQNVPTNLTQPGISPASKDFLTSSLYCKLCDVHSNGQIQLQQHLSGSKHLAKEVEYRKNREAGVHLSPTQLAPVQRGPSAPLQHGHTKPTPAPPQKTGVPTKNSFGVLSSTANLSPSPTVQNSTTSPLSKIAGKPAANNGAAVAQGLQGKLVGVGPPPVISPQSQNWLKNYRFRLACEKCYVAFPGRHGYSSHRYQPNSNHHCYGGWLVCQLRSMSTPAEEIWGRIRSRTKPDFMGPYSLCEQFNRGIYCKVSEESCWYCHSQEEMTVWNADRAGGFNGKEIIKFLRYQQGIGVTQPREVNRPDQGGARQQGNNTGGWKRPQQPSLGIGASKMAPIAVPNAGKAVLPEQLMRMPVIAEDCKKSHLMLMARIRGHFLFLCGRCFNGAPQIMVMQKPSQPVCNNDDAMHPWESNKLLVHILNEAGRVRYQKVRPRPKAIPARAYLCFNIQKQFGCQMGDSCKFAHNKIEIEVWEFEVLHSLTREVIVQLCAEAVSPHPRPQPNHTPAATAVAPAVAPATKQQPLPEPSLSEAIPKFIYDLKCVCNLCYPRHIAEENPRKPGVCAGPSSHPWKHTMVVVYSASKKKWCVVKPRHSALRREIAPTLCKHMEKCTRASCMFPHSKEESALWKYMAQYNLKTLDEVMAVVRRSSAKPSINGTTDPSTVSRVAPPLPKPANSAPMVSAPFTVQRYYCSYCDRPFQQAWRLEHHTQTMEHRSKVNSDKERQWKHRSPPWNVVNGEYQGCVEHMRRMCRFTDSSPENNNCTKAHSPEELEEWRERHQYRMMKMRKAKEQKLFAFMDEVLEKYNFSTSEMSVITEDLPGIHVECPEDLNKFIHTERKPDTTFSFTWKFVIKSKKQQLLKRVGLLYDEHRLHFYLSSPKDEEKPQVCPGNQITAGDGKTYNIDVLFHSRMLGSFNQWVLFDFGSYPVLVRKLEAHVGSQEHFETFKKIQQKKQIQTWDSSNSEIVKFKDGSVLSRGQMALQEKLLATYKPPASLSIDDIELNRLDRDNYKLHMHKMLHLEERERTKRIARFSIETTLKVASTIEVAGQGHHFAVNGQMFATINLKQALMDDSEASQIIIRSVQKMLLKFDKTNKVYEAIILQEQDFGGQKRDTISLKLSPDSVKDHNLSDGDQRTIQVQFLLDRLPFCHQHNAVDQLHNMDMVFPPPNSQRFPYIDANNLQETNFRQERAASFICKHGGSDAFPMHGVGPMLVYGPFGTGKTYTIATAVKRTVSTRPKSKILICTQSNSAADWYITEYLHKYVEQTWDRLQLRMIRIYATYRNLNTIDPVVMPYVFIDDMKQIRIPDNNTIRQYHIVITTVAMSSQLGLDGLQGHFTHILIDEAGQTLETEVLQPLTLASSKTCVVLSGDHIQMSPKVFSETARSAKFNKSLLERLFTRKVTSAFLTFNYRTCGAITNFISDTYYQGILTSHGQHPLHPEYYPLMFCAVKGEDQQVGMSYINNHEVLEIVFRAEELCRKWPKNWGNMNKNSIGIVAPYTMQVRQIRTEMRRRGLGDIAVETVEKVQGKQFRALLISTVRTRNTLKKSHLTVVSQAGSSGQQDEEFYYGFLSDHKLLNTALTRAQSLVVVAGDPIALCSEGQCATTWKAYLKECEKNSSLQGTTVEEVRQEVEAAKQHLNPFAKPFQPSKTQPSPPREEPGLEKLNRSQQQPGLIQMPSGQNPWKIPPKVSNLILHPETAALGIVRQISEEFPALTPRSVHQDVSGNNYDQSEDDDKWSVDDDVEVNLEDAILRELQRQVLEDRGELEENAAYAISDPEAGVLSENETYQDVGREILSETTAFELPNIQEENVVNHLISTDKKAKNLADKMHSTRKMRNVRMVQQKGHMLLIEDTYDRSRLVGADTFEDYDSDEDLEEDDVDDNVRQENLDLVDREPEKFKICSFHFDLSGHTYALPKDGDSSSQILITSKRKRGKALNLDEVIVEILDDVDELENAAGYSVQETVEEKKTYGKVVCILKRGANPYLKKIVCTIDKFTDNLMVPIDRTFPKIFSYTRKSGEQNSKAKSKKYQASEYSTVSIFSICRSSDQGFQFERNIEVSRKDRQNKLFIVQYLKWHAKTPYPVGIVTEELPPGDTKENGLRILKLVHGIREKWKPAIIEEVTNEFPEDWKIPDEEIKSRYDARSRVVFTIDPPESQDLDDALSVDMVDGNYFIGIHIADVSYFVKRGTTLDNEAKERATSFYPCFAKPINMLPPHLSNKMCSLLPEQDRLALSVFVTMDENGTVVGDVKIVRSVIRSRMQLTYDAAEKLIRMTSEEKEMNSKLIFLDKIMTLSRLAKERRRIRLGDGRFAYSHADEEEVVQHPLAHSLVEEMMLLANEAVARFLMMRYPDHSPLRRQLPPNEDEVNKWMDKHAEDVPNSVDLQSRVRQKVEDKAESDVHVLRDEWEKLRDVVYDDEQSDMTTIADIVCSDQNHPHLAVAQANFFRIQEKAVYISSGDHSSDIARRHHSLRMPAYTHFTSPIRRYIDLVVHRLLVVALEDNQCGIELPSDLPYTPAELAEICHHCTIQAMNCKDFDRKIRAFQLALKLKEAPHPIKAFVDNVSDTSLGLMFPYRRFIPSRFKNIPLRLLKPIKKPVIMDDSGMELEWKHRIYDVSHTLSKVHVHPKSVLTLAKERFVFQVPSRQWQEILTGIKTEDIYQIRNAVKIASDDQQRRDQDREARQRQKPDPEVPYTLPVVEVTCESTDPKKPSLFVNFKQSFNQGDVIQVQLNAVSHVGILSPRIQLFGLTPKLSFCTEHRKDAIESFAMVATCHPVGLKTVSVYKKVWLPIIEMLTAHNAVQSDETVIIYGIKISWERVHNQQTNTYDYFGYFSIPEVFCDDHHFRFNSLHKPGQNEKPDVGNDDPEPHLDYLCIRYSDVDVSHQTKLKLREMDSKPGVVCPTASVHPGKMTFVMHAATVNVTKDKGVVVVQLAVTQFSSQFPDVLLSSNRVPTCTVELIPKTEPDRRLESAVRKLDSDRVSPLIRDICLLQKPRTNPDDPFSKLLPSLAQKITSFGIRGSPFDEPNASQSKALRQALAQPFTVIQGPPGTGKTITGAHLAHFFTQMNRGLPPSGKGPPQVLYCGPSNKSVDVIATYLKKLKAKMVRVYSETIERENYPIPGEPGTTRKAGSSREAKMDPFLAEISLHRLIRLPSNSHSSDILKMEKYFHTEGSKITPLLIKNYRRIISNAEEEELKKYQIILCTCNASGSKRIRDYTNVVQCIIDEAGMCNEPETLIPLVSTNPCQVVLIGDHKQLRPIIQEKTAQLLGMEISLLEKYEKKAQMLTMQYRMHESICAFPSQAFYEGKLETADIVKGRNSDTPLQNIWPGGSLYPLVFCHLYGKEETLTVKTAEGNEQSKSNPQEVKHVVRIATALVHCGIRAESIVVLSQYRLQCAEIEDALKKQGLKHIAVRTVITSQGSEWDYVIMSTVRSLPRIEIEEKASTGWKQRNLGFIIDENQMNVAITRARRGLIIVGNQYLLQTHDKWKELIDMYRQKGAVVDARSFLRLR